MSRRPAGALLFDTAEAGDFGLEYTIKLQKLPAEFFANSLRGLFRVMLYLDFQKQIGAAHGPFHCNPASSTHAFRAAGSRPFYTEKMVCAICAVRRPKRHCPGVGGEICSICCGTEREVTVTCPLDCEYLLDSRRHEKAVVSDPRDLPDRDIRVSDAFLREHEELLMALAGIVAAAAIEAPGVVDGDVRDALIALVRTYRTLESGVYYETRPENALASRLFRMVQERIQQYRTEEQRRLGMPKTRDVDVLQCLVFLERAGFEHNNGRPRGRVFISLLRSIVQSPEQRPAARDSLILLP
jgi:hypothetical protein